MKKRYVIVMVILAVAACQKQSLYHQLTVEKGEGSGEYELATEVQIVAQEADTGMLFSHWSGDTTHLTDPKAAATSCIMPLEDIAVTAVFREAPYYPLNVLRGSGSGQYQEGSLVSISADPPLGDSAFFEWVGDVDYVDQIKSPNAQVTMPTEAVTIRAAYSALPKYMLTVNQGFGDGEYLAGTVVTISPDPPANKFFSAWTGDVQYLNDIYDEQAEVTMPAQPVDVTATFENAISFSSQVMPLFNAECSTSGCHDANSPNEPLTNYAEIVMWDQDIRYRVETGNMPPSIPLTTQQKQIIIKWIDQGSHNN
jgi:hypothetical protein